jgi:hypothetical protein
MMPTFRAARLLLPCTLMAALSLAACAGLGSTPATSSAGQPAAASGAAPPHLQFLDMADTLQADPVDAGKKLLSVSIHVRTASASTGIIALEMIVDPGSAAPWPRPAYAGGSPAAAVQQVKLAAGDGQITAEFPLRTRLNGKVQPDVYNIQSGGFYDVLIFGGGLPASANAPTMAAFQTSRLYALPDFGGPPATPTPVPTATPAGSPQPVATLYPSPTFAPTSTPQPTATPLPPPFAVGLLNVQVLGQLQGTVGALPGSGSVPIAAPAGQRFVVAVFVVRRDLPTSGVNPLPVKLSTAHAGPWQPDNAQINSQTGSLQVAVPPYGPLTIVYDPRSQADHERQVAAQIWLVPAADAASVGDLRFDGQPASAYPATAVTWVDPGFPYHLKDTIKLDAVSNIQVMQVKTVQLAAGTPVPGAPAGPGLQATLAITGATTTPLTLNLQLQLEDQQGLRSRVDCPTQTYPKLVLGSPQQFACTVPFPAGGSPNGGHLGVTGTVNGGAIATQWVALPG